MALGFSSSPESGLDVQATQVLGAVLMIVQPRMAGISLNVREEDEGWGRPEVRMLLAAFI